jgi:multiple antibiotic resistance protein
LLGQLGVSLAALKAAGGTIILIIALDMIFARPSGALTMTASEAEEAERKAEIAVFPLATPLLAGPGAMSAAVLLAAKAHGDLVLHAVVAGALIMVMAVTTLCLLLAQQIHDLLSVTAQKVIVRVFGILLATVAMQSLFDGIVESGIFAGRGSVALPLRQ